MFQRNRIRHNPASPRYGGARRTRHLRFEPLEQRQLLAVDFGNAVFGYISDNRVLDSGVVVTRIDNLETTDNLDSKTIAMSDSFSFRGTNEWQLDVLANDVVAEGSDGARIVSVLPDSRLDVNISDDGQSLSVVRNEDLQTTYDYYLSYTIADDFGKGSTTWVSVEYTPLIFARHDSATTMRGESAIVDVLANDGAANGTPSISELDMTETRGTVELASGAIRYTPAEDFVGRDTFRYLIEDVDGNTAWGTATIHVGGRIELSPDDVFVNYSLDVTDDDDNAVDRVRIGDKFTVGLYVEHMSAYPQGVFAAFADILFDPNLVERDGKFAFRGPYKNLSGADRPGLIDELGGIAGISPHGGGRHLVAEIPFVAIADGTVDFELDPADDEVQNATLVYNLSTIVPRENISYENVVPNFDSVESGDAQNTTAIVDDSTWRTQAPLDGNQGNGHAIANDTSLGETGSVPANSNNNVYVDEVYLDVNGNRNSRLDLLVPFVAGETMQFEFDSADDEVYHTKITHSFSTSLLDENISYGYVVSNIGSVETAIAQDIVGSGAGRIVGFKFASQGIDHRPNTDLAKFGRAVLAQTIASDNDRIDVNHNRFFSPLAPLALSNALPSAAVATPQSALLQRADFGPDDSTRARRRPSALARRSTYDIRDEVFQKLAADDTDTPILPSLRTPGPSEART